ncbi:unnamed protein product [Calypogeia fissa]
MVLPGQAKSSKDIRSLLHFYHKNKEGVFKSLREFDLSEKIIEAISRGERSISTQLLSQRDLKTLKQLGDHGTESVEVVDLVVEFPWDAGSFLTIVGKANDMQLRRQVLVMAVDRIRKTAEDSKFRKNSGVERTIHMHNTGEPLSGAGTSTV